MWTLSLRDDIFVYFADGRFCGAIYRRIGAPVSDAQLLAGSRGQIISRADLPAFLAARLAQYSAQEPEVIFSPIWASCHER
jgi:hypothetical protein